MKAVWRRRRAGQWWGYKRMRMRLQVERVGFAILSFILALNFDVVERGEPNWSVVMVVV